MKGCVPMKQNENLILNHSKHNTAENKKQDTAEKNKAKDPPGVHMPPEKEMSPPQFG